VNDARSGWTAVLGALALVLALPTPLDSVRWWRSSRVAAALALTPQQADAIQRIHQSMDAQAIACERDALAARADLDRALLSESVDDTSELAALRAADAEAECRRTRTLMLYRMYQQLSPEQRRLLATLAARRPARAPP
jgi:hypothetical protein